MSRPGRVAIAPPSFTTSTLIPNIPNDIRPMTLSSPMTVDSHLSGASDALPPLTAGTTATSPAPRSPSLTPPPPSKPVSKRKAPSGAEDTPKKRAKDTPTKAKASEEDDAKPEKGTYCHQCRTKCDPDGVLRCTKLRKYTKATPPRACNLAWCLRDLEKRYGIDVDAVRKKGKNGSGAEREGHDHNKPYVFACPCCLDECQNATCRKKKGLESLGDVVKLAAQAGVSVVAFVKKFDEDAPKLRPDTSAIVSLSDSELSELEDSDVKPKVKTVTSKKAATPKKAVKDTTKGKKKAEAKDAKGKKAVKGKDAKGKETKGKATAKDVKSKTGAKGKAVKPKVEKKQPPPMPEPILYPPAIETVPTRHSKGEIEQRAFLREFIVRFRFMLNLPERALAPLDDFDHALSEASVRTIAGAMLEIIHRDFEDKMAMASGDEAADFEELADLVADKREEMRHYADLARFGQVFNSLHASIPELELPPAPESNREQNDRAMRALLDLAEDEPTPSWMTESGPSRRGASRIPAAPEIIRMLLAFVNYLVPLEITRAHMETSALVSEFEERRKLQALLKEEKKRFTEAKKKIHQDRIAGIGPQDGIFMRKRMVEVEKEHTMLKVLYDVNFRTMIARNNTQFEPLGVDLDGRVYYALTPRLIEEERYRPTGWAKTLFIWGTGFPSEGGPKDDDMPLQLERWHHVSDAPTIFKLHLYLANRAVRRRDQMAAEVAAAKPKATPAKGKARATPKSTPKPKSSGTPQRMTLDGVVPSRRQSLLANGNAPEDGNESDGSELSSVPSETEDLLALMNPPGYVKSGELMFEEQSTLVNGIDQFGRVLELLACKGY